MKRRSFLAALFAAPSAAAAAVYASPKTGGFVTPRTEPVLPAPASPAVENLSALSANIDPAHAGILRLPDNGMVIDLAGGRMIIRC